ncbi:MAG: reductive dehalogenase domain-containing protein [Candidatus Aminicenantes bacterium]|jgi:reductive dehalogenase
MNVWTVLGEFSFLILIFFLLVFSLYNLVERERRAFWWSAIFLVGLVLLNFGFRLVKAPLENWLFGAVFTLFIIILVLLLVPSLRKRSVEIVGEQKKIDERDVIFARFDLMEGTENFKYYYERKPEYKKTDGEIRKIPDILESSHFDKNPELFSLATVEFDFLEHQLTQVQGKVFKEKTQSSPAENTQLIKNIIKYLGGDICGVCLLDQAYIYSHVGRGPEPYGQKIIMNHKYAIAFALEMDLEMIASAPRAPVIVETGRKYVEAARISIMVASFIRRMGFPARAHIAGSNYQVMLPPLAWKCGLGELGRLGILITGKYGPRIRLGLVTTDIPLVPDVPRSLGVQEFCRKCQKCARNCPAQAIPYGDKSEEKGVLKWVLNREECYRFWRKAGTDCAVCISVCPFSKPDNSFHNLIRRVAERSSFAQNLSIWADDFFYGRSPRPKKSPLGN